MYKFSKNHVFSSVRKHYCALGLELELAFVRVRAHGLDLGLGLGLAVIHFRSNVFSSKCSRISTAL